MPDAWDELFGQTAIAHGFLTQRQWNRLQEDPMVKKGVRHAPALALERGFLVGEEFERILDDIPERLKSQPPESFTRDHDGNLSERLQKHRAFFRLQHDEGED